MNNYQGWLNVYKPINLSSFKALYKIKKKLNISKIGHAGTLDPLAEGVLPIAIGKTTKLISFISKSIKEYEFEIKWGLQTSTDDKEGEIIDHSSNIPNEREIVQKLKNFKGTISQTPPQASAIKINGIRAYKLFRNNKKFEINSKFVELHDCQIIESKNNLTKMKILCGKGFYVRSFARDLALELNTKGHIF